jgi:hypothetical protein
MKKMLLAAVALSALAFPVVSSIAAPRDYEGGSHHEFSAEDHAAFTDAHVAALKAGLKLTAAQEKNWPTLETALRDQAKARAARFAEWRDHAKEEHRHRDALDVLRQRSKALTTRATELDKLAEAAKPLYDSLDEAQKHRFGMLLRAGGGHHKGWGGHFGGHRHDADEGHDG